MSKIRLYVNVRPFAKPPQRAKKPKVPGRRIRIAAALMAMVGNVSLANAERIIRWRANRGLPLNVRGVAVEE